MNLSRKQAPEASNPQCLNSGVVWAVCHRHEEILTALSWRNCWRFPDATLVLTGERWRPRSFQIGRMWDLFYCLADRWL